MQHVMQPPLIYPIEAVKASQIYRKFLSLNQEPDEPSSLAYYEQLAKIVKHEWHRIGGQNWLVSQCVPNRKSRELIKKIIPDCIFVTLTLSSEAQEQRLEKRLRHFLSEEKKGMMTMLTKAINSFEPAEKDEDRAVDVVITPDLDPNGVLNKILEAIKIFE